MALASFNWISVVRQSFLLDINLFGSRVCLILEDFLKSIGLDQLYFFSSILVPKHHFACPRENLLIFFSGMIQNLP